ncbi:hypothetical protein HOU95_gp047 [Streptomyces phage Hiyaa]|uniref:Uncharacterized protein n=1 Tax=Streptomyces phage Hiyaa TaxID=2499072 RepID=A0A3S9U920_9CAUD|nr:hypothetical protein HOU95_gp047 [Streptomyces phage Hiyaa]AZS06760.1 hypothetical protein SEA_HIYAA_121 [Streptomyces phage Hiyaa]
MAHLDLRAAARAQHTEQKAGHAAATLETTRMHMEADAAEERGEYYTADLTRRAADEQQAAANRRWRPLSN